MWIKADCPDGSDESETCQRNACPTEMFTCSNGRCIDLMLKCNGVSECEDDSDEQYCKDTGNRNYVNCTVDQYKCFNTELCLPKQVRLVNLALLFINFLIILHSFS